MNSQIGARGQVFHDGRDLTRFARSFNISAPVETVDGTKLRPPDFFREFNATLRAGTAGFVGDLPSNQTQALAELNDALHSRTGRALLLAPFGAEVGRLAVAGRGIRTALPNDVTIAGLISYAQDWQMTSASGQSALAEGLCLFSPNGAGSIALDEVKQITADNVSGNGVFALPATSLGAGGTLTVTPSDTAASLQTKIRAIAGYNSVGVTVSGSLGAQGGTNEVHTIGGSPTGTGTVYGDVALTLGMTAGTLQTAIRAKGGEWTNVTVTGSSSAGTITSITVTGAGDSAYNGTYSEDGESGGRPRYTNGARYLFSDGTDWFFDTAYGAGGSGSAYYTISPSATPPASGWATNTGVAPAPTLATTGGASSANYSVVFPNLNATDIGANLGNGWTGAVSQQGAVPGTGGTFTIAFAGALATTNIDAWTKTSGAGWSTTTTVEGGLQSERNVITAPTTAAGVRDQNGVAPNPAAASSRGALAVLQVPELFGSGKTVTVVIEDAPDSGGAPGTWAALTTFDPMTEAGAQFKAVAAGVAIQPWVRARVSAVTGSAVLAVAFARL